MIEIKCLDCYAAIGRIWEEGGVWCTADENGKPAGWARSYTNEEHAAGEVRAAHGRRNGHGGCAR
jgi:hypothetical protein